MDERVFSSVMEVLSKQGEQGTFDQCQKENDPDMLG